MSLYLEEFFLQIHSESTIFRIFSLKTDHWRFGEKNSEKLKVLDYMIDQKIRNKNKFQVRLFFTLGFLYHKQNRYRGLKIF